MGTSQRAGDRRRWAMLAVLFTARLAVGLQFQTAGSVTPVVLEEFGAGYTGLGTLVGLFMLPGIFLAIPIGFIGLHVADKTMAVCGLALLAIGSALSGVAGDYTMVAAGRLLGGAGGAIMVIVMTKMLADWFAGHEIFLGMAIFIIGWPVGIAIGQALQPILAEAMGWRAVFLSSGVMCIVAMVLIALLYRPAPDAPEVGRGGLSKLDGRELFLVNLAGLAWMFVNGAYLVLVAFGPVHLDERGLAFAEAAQVTSVMSLVFFFALPAGGYLATRYGLPKTVLSVGIGGTVLVCAAIPYVGAPLVMFALFGTLYAAAAPVLGALPAQLLSPENRAPGMGLYYVWFFLGCTALPIAGGYLNEMAGTANAPILFAAAMMLATLILAHLVYAAQRRLAQ